MTTNEARAQGRKILAVIDGKSVYYRGYYAMPNLTTLSGEPTGGVYGFASLALELIRRIEPSYVAVAWDKPHTNIRRRKAIYDGYKSNRHPAPPDFYAQLPTLRRLLKALNWPVYQYDDYEADDIMGSLSDKANAVGIHTVLISSDLDMLQLIDDDTEVYAMKKGLKNLERFDVRAFQDRYGIRVEQFLDLKSLKGDSSDCIPGVPGVGEKTGIKLLQQYGTLDGVYAHIDEISGSLHDKLVSGKASAYMSKELARIWRDAPVPLDLDAMDVTKLDRHELYDTLKDLQFNSLLRRLPETMRLEQADAAADATSDVLDLPALTVSSSAPDAAMGETVALALRGDEVALTYDGKTVYRVDIRALASLIQGKRVVVHDAKVLGERLLSEAALLCFTVEWDTKHGSFLLDSRGKSRPLSDIAGEGAGVVTQLAWTIKLWREQRAAFVELPRLLALARRVDFPLQLVLAKIEQRGMLVDPSVLKEQSDAMVDEINELAQDIYGFAGEEFNLASTKQLSQVLFDKLGLPPVGKRGVQGTYSTGAKVLERLAPRYPIARLIERYRELTKLKSTYLDALPQAIAADGRIHTAFNQDVTSTGRLSSSNPNLQNIPTRSKQGRMIKEAFIAPEGRVIINADYAQFELRLAAALGHDEDMVKMFADPTNDIHRMTAAQAYRIDPSEVTPDQRRHAKVINFGILYGMSPKGLADATGMSMAQASRFIQNYFAARQPIKDYLDATLKQARERGYVETLFGRRRYTPDVKSTNYGVRAAAERAAMNMPIQGTEADLMKMAMLKVEQIPGASQIMQVHDSVMVECDAAEAARIAQAMKDVMENIYPALGVRLLVDVRAGQRWADL